MHIIPTDDGCIAHCNKYLNLSFKYLVLLIAACEIFECPDYVIAVSRGSSYSHMQHS